MANNRRNKKSNPTDSMVVTKPIKLSKDNTIVANIKLSEIPQPVQRGKGNRLGTDVYTVYGANNLYPNYLLRLYNESSIHKSIVDAKVNYILGEGVINRSTKELFEADVNTTGEDIEDLMRKVAKDFVIFNYFAVEVVFANDGSIYELNHFPAHKIRTNSDHTHFWYSEDWSNPRVETLDFERYYSDVEGSLETKVFFYSGYTPNVHSTYPTPEYSGAIKSIEIDIAIKDFHLNNIHNSFSGNTIISFFRGEPTPEIKDDIVDSITGSYSGTKGDKVIFQFLEKDEQAPEITQLGVDGWNEAYLTLRDDTVEDIIIAHGVTSPMLFGIKTEGQLGGSTELETAYTIFKQLWVRVKRREIVNSLNALFEGTYPAIDIEDREKLFPTEMSDSLKEKIMTINELRETEGLAPIEGGDRLITEPIVVKEEAVQKAESMGLSKQSQKELELGINPYKELSDEEEDEFETIGLSKDDVVVIESHSFNKQVNDVMTLKFSMDRLTNYLMETRLTGKSFKTMQNELYSQIGERVSIDTIKGEYGRLVALRLIPDTKLLSKEQLTRIRNGYEGVTDSPTVDNLRKIEIRYSYDGPRDNRNRAFCGRLVRAGKLYSREDIQKIASLFGYDVFSYKGGFNCRHNWQIHSVVRKEA